MIRLMTFVVGIALFVFGWWLALANESFSILIPIAIVAGIAAITLANYLWIRWNLRIHAIKGPRRAGAPMRPLPPEDDFGRRVDFEPSAHSSRLLVLEQIDNTVRFRADEARS